MNYYYLISTLPELEIEDGALSREHLREALDLIGQNLTPTDLRIVRCLLHLNDNQNLLYVLFQEYHDFEIHTYHQPASIAIEVLENYRREMSVLPDYMINYLNDLSGSFASLSLSEMEYQLDQYFHEYLLKRDSVFLNTFYAWRYQLKHTIAEINRKAFPFLQTRNNAEAPFYAKTKTLHGLTDSAEMTNQLLPLIEAHDLDAMEIKINEYYWEFSDCWQEPFAAEQVFAYMVKLIHLYRWKSFVARGELAKEKFETLITELKERRISPKMPVI